jgi:hypothetical protein
MRILLASICVFSLAACGPSFIILEIDADLTIPSDVNSLQIITLEEADLSNELANVDFELKDGDTFPLEVLLEPSGDTPSGTLRQRVTARFDGLAVARSEVKHMWESHRTSRAKFDLITLNP